MLSLSVGCSPDVLGRSRCEAGQEEGPPSCTGWSYAGQLTRPRHGGQVAYTGFLPGAPKTVGADQIKDKSILGGRCLVSFLQETGLAGHGRHPLGRSRQQVVRGRQPGSDQPPAQEVKSCDPEDWVPDCSGGEG